MTLEIGHKIRKVRELKNFTQEYVAQKAGISAQAYSKIESGKSKLNIDRFVEIAAALEVAPEYILNFDEQAVISGTLPKRNLPRDEKTEKYIRHLEEEVSFLREKLNLSIIEGGQNLAIPALLCLGL